MKGENADVAIQAVVNGVWDGKETIERRAVYAKADGSFWINWMGGRRRVTPYQDRYIFNWQIREIKAHTFEEIFGK